MRLPEDSIVWNGRTIAVRLLEQTGGGYIDTALYQDKSGRFYIATIRNEMPFKDAASMVDVLSIERAKPAGVMAWYLREFMSAGPLRSMMRAAINAGGQLTTDILRQPTRSVKIPAGLLSLAENAGIDPVTLAEGFLRQAARQLGYEEPAVPANAVKFNAKPQRGSLR